MKFLVFSDLHLHNWQYGANQSNGWNSRLLAQKNVLDQIHRCCVDKDIKDVFFCGDLFHTHGRVDAACLSVATDFFVKLYESGIRAEVLVGNHDIADKAGMINSLRWLRGFGKATLVEDMITRPGDIKYRGVSYTEDKEKLKNALVETPAGYFVFLHQGVSGVPVGSDFVIPNEILTPDMVPSNVKHAFTGHYHSHRKVTDKLTVVGAPMQHTWADSGEDRGWLVVDSETGGYEKVLSKAPRFVKYRRDSFVKDNGYSIEGNYIRVEYYVAEHGKEEVRKSFLNLGALSVEFSYRDRGSDKQVRKSEEIFNLNDVIKRYQEAKNIDESGIRAGERLRQGTYEVNIPS